MYSDLSLLLCVCEINYMFQLFLMFCRYLERVAPNIIHEPMWYYVDESGDVEGPVPQLNVRFWIDSGFFNETMQVRHEDFTHFLKLGTHDYFFLLLFSNIIHVSILTLL